MPKQPRMPRQPGMPNMQQMMQQVQKMQQDMAAAQEELKNEVVEASAGGGMVTVKVSGALEVKGEELTIAFGSSFLKKQAEGPADRMTVGESLTALTKVRWRLAYELREELEAGDAEPQDGSEERWLARFMEEFDAEEILRDGEGAALAGEGEERTVTSNEKGA